VYVTVDTYMCVCVCTWVENILTSWMHRPDKIPIRMVNKAFFFTWPSSSRVCLAWIYAYMYVCSWFAYKCTYSDSQALVSVLPGYMYYISCQKAAYIYIYIYIYAYICIHTYIHKYIYIYIYIYIYAYICIHTYIHTRAPPCICMLITSLSLEMILLL
jgi:hypothetical protein